MSPPSISGQSEVTRTTTSSSLATAHSWKRDSTSDSLPRCTARPRRTASTAISSSVALVVVATRTGRPLAASRSRWWSSRVLPPTSRSTLPRQPGARRPRLRDDPDAGHRSASSRASTHLVDLVVGEVGEHRQRELLGVERLRVGAHPAPVAHPRVDRVPVDRQVVDLHADAGGAHLLEHLTTAAVEDPQRVEVPGRVDVVALHRHPDTVDIGQRRVVARLDLGPPRLERRAAAAAGSARARSATSVSR